MKILSRLMIALAFVPLAAVPAAAGEKKGEKIKTVEVSYSDLDLESEAGARALLERLDAAAFKACGGDPKRHSAYKARPEVTVEIFETCRKDAVAAAVGRLDAPLVAKLHGKSAA